MLTLAAYAPCVPTFGETLRTVRERHGYSQPKLAIALGHKTPSTVQSWESGRKVPRRANLRKLADTLGVPLRELTGASDLPRDAFDDGDSPVVARAIATIRSSSRELQGLLATVVQSYAREYAKGLRSSPTSERPPETPRNTPPNREGTQRRAGPRLRKHGPQHG